jgi:hypothetical protein
MSIFIDVNHVNSKMPRFGLSGGRLVTEVGQMITLGVPCDFGFFDSAVARSLLDRGLRILEFLGSGMAHGRSSADWVRSI